MLSRTRLLKLLRSSLQSGVEGEICLSRSLASNGMKTALIRHSSHFTYVPDTVSTPEGETVRMNLFQAVNNAMDIALSSDPTASKNAK
jgi:hypothetical protein